MPYNPNLYSNNRRVDSDNDDSSSDEEASDRVERRTKRQGDYVDGEENKLHYDRKPRKEATKFTPPDIVPRAGQEPLHSRSAHPFLWNHGADKTNRGYGMQAIAQANIEEAVPLESKLVRADLGDGDPYHTRNKREGLNQAGVWVTPYGEKIVLYEEPPPPPTTDKYKITEMELNRSANPRLVYAQGGVDLNAEIRHKKEVLNPAPTRDPHPEEDRARQDQHMKSRQGIQIYMNRNGDRGFDQLVDGGNDILTWQDTINYVYDHMKSVPKMTTREEAVSHDPGHEEAQPGAVPKSVQDTQRRLQRTGHYYSGDDLGNKLIYDYKPFGESTGQVGSVSGHSDDRAITQRAMLTTTDGHYYTGPSSAQYGGGDYVTHDTHMQNHTDRSMVPLLPEYMGHYAVTKGSYGPEQHSTQGYSDHIDPVSGAQTSYDPGHVYAENTNNLIYSTYYDPLTQRSMNQEQVMEQGAYSVYGQSDPLRNNNPLDPNNRSMNQEHVMDQGAHSIYGQSDPLRNNNPLDPTNRGADAKMVAPSAVNDPMYFAQTFNSYDMSQVQTDRGHTGNAVHESGNVALNHVHQGGPVRSYEPVKNEQYRGAEATEHAIYNNQNAQYYQQPVRGTDTREGSDRDINSQYQPSDYNSGFSQYTVAENFRSLAVEGPSHSNRNLEVDANSYNMGMYTEVGHNDLRNVQPVHETQRSQTDDYSRDLVQLGGQFEGSGYDRAHWDTNVTQNQHQGPKRADYGETGENFIYHNQQNAVGGSSAPIHSRHMDQLPTTTRYQNTLDNPDVHQTTGFVDNGYAVVPVKEGQTVSTYTDNRGFRDVADFRLTQKVGDGDAATKESYALGFAQAMVRSKTATPSIQNKIGRETPVDFRSLSRTAFDPFARPLTPTVQSVMREAGSKRQ